MPTRKYIFQNGEIYHVYNKTIAPYTAFETAQCTDRFRDLLSYYIHTKARISFSKYLALCGEQKNILDKQLNESSPRVEIIAYALMPNHFHLLLKQTFDKGIPVVVSNCVNAFTRYYNLLHVRRGPLFLPQFNAKRIFSVEQLLHTSRYIHLNPLTSNLCTSFEELICYPLCSLHEYASAGILCNTQIVLQYFRNSAQSYLDFVAKNEVYQRELAVIKKREKRKRSFI